MKVRLGPEASFYSRFRKQCLAVWAACSGLVPSFRARVFSPSGTVLWPHRFCAVGKPLTASVPEESEVQDEAQKVEADSASRPAEWGFWGFDSGLKLLVSILFRKQRLALWAAGSGLVPSFKARVFGPCDRVLRPQLCRRKASCKTKQASWRLAVQEGQQNEGSMRAWS